MNNYKNKNNCCTYLCPAIQKIPISMHISISINMCVFVSVCVTLGLTLVCFGFTIGKTHTHTHTHVARPHACMISHPPSPIWHLVPGQQIASLWSPPHRRAIHVCITIFQHIWARTRSAITHHPHQHQPCHPHCHRHRPHSWPHRWPSNSWAARSPPWHRQRSWLKRCAMPQVMHPNIYTYIYLRHRIPFIDQSIECHEVRELFNSTIWYDVVYYMLLWFLYDIF